MDYHNYFKSVADGYVIGIGETTGTGNITEEEYNTLKDLFNNRPTAPQGYIYKLTDTTHEWVKCESGGGL